MSAYPSVSLNLPADFEADGRSSESLAGVSSIADRGRYSGCISCGAPAAIRSSLKIRQKTRQSPWGFDLCAGCAAAVKELGPVRELLWFQSRGIDILALASRSRTF